jgi:rhodanese-related sulfurtransferase
MVPNISIKDLLSLNTPNIIDIRGIENYNNNHIPGAINIPFEILIINPEQYLNKNQRYYLYCKRGYTSIKACQILNRMGYNTTNIYGGYEEWLLTKED